MVNPATGQPREEMKEGVKEDLCHRRPDFGQVIKRPSREETIDPLS